MRLLWWVIKFTQNMGCRKDGVLQTLREHLVSIMVIRVLSGAQCQIVKTYVQAIRGLKHHILPFYTLSLLHCALSNTPRMPSTHHARLRPFKPRTHAPVKKHSSSICLACLWGLGRRWESSDEL